MPTGVYSRKRSKAVHKQVAALIGPPKKRKKQLVMRVLLMRDGQLSLQSVTVRSLFKAFQLLLEDYADADVQEVRIA